jgi:DNA-binding transcriptional LysR family regulator
MDTRAYGSQIQLVEENFRNFEMAIKIEMLRSFAAVAQTGNLADAATRLGRTQSAVSMTLKQLEGNIGAKLFDGERKSQLSPIGAEIFELALNQLRQFDETVEAIQSAASSPQGLIRIVSVPSLVGLVVPQSVRATSDKYPGIRFHLRDADTGQVMNELVQGRADIGLASGQHALNGVSITSLFSDNFGLICAADHPLILQEHAPTIDEVMRAGFVTNNLCSSIRSKRFQDAIADAPVTAQTTLSLAAMVRTRDWVTVLPETVAHIMPRDLAFRSIAELDARRQVFLYERNASQHPEFVSEFGDMIRSSAARLRLPD